MLFGLKRFTGTTALILLVVLLCFVTTSNASSSRDFTPHSAVSELEEPKAELDLYLVVEIRTYLVLVKTKDVCGRVFHHLDKPFQVYAVEHFYYGYRWYDASKGSWINRDPIKEDGGLNVYNFCDGDPINHIDVLGLKIHLGTRPDKNLVPEDDGVHRRQVANLYKDKYGDIYEELVRYGYALLKWRENEAKFFEDCEAGDAMWAKTDINKERAFVLTRRILYKAIASADRAIPDEELEGLALLAYQDYVWALNADIDNPVIEFLDDNEAKVHVALACTGIMRLHKGFGRAGGIKQGIKILAQKFLKDSDRIAARQIPKLSPQKQFAKDQRRAAEAKKLFDDMAEEYGVQPQLALPGPKVKAQWGVNRYRHGGEMSAIEHIVYRHAHNCGFNNVSHFSKGMGAGDIKKLVDDALRNGKVTLGRGNAFTIEHDFGRVIGTNSSGGNATNLRIHVRDDKIQTAFPF